MAILQNKFVREDGSIIGSSVIISCKYTSDVNSQTNLTVGDTTAAEVDVEIRNLAKEIVAGEKLTYYQIEDSVENLIGVFYTEAPTVATKTSIRFKAYDGKAKLAVDFSEWLNNHQEDFPMTVRSLGNAACEVAGLVLAADSFQFENLSVPAFYAQGVTCRQIIGWIAQLNGSFVSCNTAGEIFFDWYRETATWVSAKQTSISSDYSFSIRDGHLILSYQGEMPQYSINESGHLILSYAGEEPNVRITENGHLVQSETVTHQYRMDSLSKNSYSTETIKRVQIKQETNDVGIIYPAEADGNVFVISQNGIAALLDSDTLRSVAQYLFDRLKSISYTPLSFRLPRTASIKAGDIISVTDGNGNTVKTYVMKVYLDSSGTQISSTGDQDYADKAAVSSEQYKNIPGKVLLLEKSVDGLIVENRDMADKYAKLQLNVDEISTEVGNAQGDISELQQTAGEVHVSASKYATVSTSYYFSHDDDGNLILTYTGEKPDYSIDEDGNLVLTYTGDKPDIWVDEDGYILTTEESLGTAKVLGTLSTVIDGNGTWESKFVSDGKTVSSLYFDFSNSRFVFNGHVVATSGEIGDCSILGGKLLVPAANITGTLVIGNLPDGVAMTDDIPDDEYITKITNDTLKTTNVVAENLTVKAVNVDGELSADKIKSGTLTSSTVIIPLNVTKSYVDNGALLDGKKLGFFEDSVGMVFTKDGIYHREGAHQFRAVELSQKGCVLNGTVTIDDTLKTSTGDISVCEDSVKFSNGASIVVYSNNMYMGGLWMLDGGEAVTSDAKKKHDILSLDDRYITLFDLVRPVAYKYNNGTSGRYHTGFIANEVEEALEKAGISTQEFAGFVTVNETNDEGEMKLTRCLRYEEFIAVLWHKVKQLEKKLEAQYAVN